MKKILMRPKDIKNCWETEDACIVEEYNGKKWICEKFYTDENGDILPYLFNGIEHSRTFDIVKNSQNETMIELNLLVKGKVE